MRDTLDTAIAREDAARRRAAALVASWAAQDAEAAR